LLYALSVIVCVLTIIINLQVMLKPSI